MSKPQRRVVLVFGEHDHDRRAICRLTMGLRPDLQGQVEPRKTPLVLIKNATPDKAKSNAEKIAKLVKQEGAARTVVAVLAHEDCDAMEPAHVAVADKIEKALGAAGCPGKAIGVTPAWEIEAWWFVFPDAVAPVVKGWRTPDDCLGRDVGKLQNAKEALIKAVRPKDGKSKPRDYAEADSPQIADNLVSMKLLPSFDAVHRTTEGSGDAKVRTHSASFGAFRAKALALP